MMKKLLAALLLLPAFCLGFSKAQAADYKQEYKLSVVPGATSGWGQSASHFADLVREKSNGRINIKVYPSAQLLAGKQTSEFPMLRNGAIDFAMASTINWSPQIKELNRPALPFFLAVQPDRYKAMDAILSGKSGQMMRDAVEDKGVKIIGWAENGFRELGANPMNINWSEATTGFQQGLVDGQENPTNGINIPLKIWDFHKHHSDWHYIIDPLLLGVNPDVWKSFSEEDQKLLLEAAAETEKYSKAISRVGLDNGEALEYLKSVGKTPEITEPYAFMEQQGMVVTRPTPEQIQQFHDATAKTRADWTQKIGPDLVKAAEEDMAQVK